MIYTNACTNDAFFRKSFPLLMSSSLFHTFLLADSSYLSLSGIQVSGEVLLELGAEKFGGYLCDGLDMGQGPTGGLLHSWEEDWGIGFRGAEREIKICLPASMPRIAYGFPENNC